MFEPADIMPAYALSVLSIEKLLHDYLGDVLGLPIDADYLYECRYEAIDEIAEYAVYAYSRGGEMNIDHIVFPSMRQFYSLCREHSRRNRISFKNNPYVQEAAKFVENQMRNIDDYDINWRLQAPKKEYPKKHCELIVYTGMEFFQPVELVESLCKIREYYIDAEKKLRLELYGEKTNEPPVLLLPSPPAERREAA